MSKMYSYTLTASFLFIFAVRGLSACIHDPCPNENLDEDHGTISPEREDHTSEFISKRLSHIYDTKKYPYMAIVFYKCKKVTGNALGVIISESRVLLSTSEIMKNVGGCTYEVLVGADKYAEGGAKYEAESVRIGDKEKLTLLKLKTPIKFRSQAQSIPLISEKPAVGSQALFNSWMNSLKENKKEGIFATNVTLIDKEECKKVISWNSNFVDRFDHHENSFCIRNFQHPCLHYSSSALIANGKLAGLDNDAYNAVRSINSYDYIYSFYDIAHYSSSIKSHM